MVSHILSLAHVSSTGTPAGDFECEQGKYLPLPLHNNLLTLFAIYGCAGDGMDVFGEQIPHHASDSAVLATAGDVLYIFSFFY